MVKVAFSFNSQGTERIELFSHGAYESISLRYEGLITFDYKYEEISVLLSSCKVMAERR